MKFIIFALLLVTSLASVAALEETNDKNLIETNLRFLGEDDSDLPAEEADEETELNEEFETWFDDVEYDDMEHPEDEEEESGDEGGRDLMVEDLPQEAGIRGARKLNSDQPDRFFLRFSDAYLVHVPGTSTLQIITENNVLSYGGDWEVVQIYGYLYHMRQRNWQNGDFFWKVNTSRREVYMVRHGTWGQIGPASSTWTISSIGVDNVGSSMNPSQFFLRLRDAYLVYRPQYTSLQIAAANCVLSYGGDWEAINMKTYLFHMRQYNWSIGDFYWKINTSRMEAYRVRGGPFAGYGGEYQPMPDMTVQPFY